MRMSHDVLQFFGVHPSVAESGTVHNEPVGIRVFLGQFLQRYEILLAPVDLAQKQLVERLGMNLPRTIIDLETCQSNQKLETVVLVTKELNISIRAIFPEMVNQTVSKTVVDFFAGKSEAEIEKFIVLSK